MAIRKKQYIGRKKSLFHSPRLEYYLREKMGRDKYDRVVESYLYIWNTALYAIILLIWFVLTVLDGQFTNADFAGFMACSIFLHKTLLL